MSLVRQLTKVVHWYTAVRSLTRIKPCEHISPVLASLHWLPVTHTLSWTHTGQLHTLSWTHTLYWTHTLSWTHTLPCACLSTLAPCIQLILLLTYDALNGVAPNYLKEFVSPYSPPWHLGLYPIPTLTLSRIRTPETLLTTFSWQQRSSFQPDPNSHPRVHFNLWTS